MNLQESNLFTSSRPPLKTNIASLILADLEFFNGVESVEEIKSRTLNINELFNNNSVRLMMDSIVERVQVLYDRRRLGYKDLLTLVINNSFINNQLVFSNLEDLLYELSPSGVKIVIVYPVNSNQFDSETSIYKMVLELKDACRKQDLIGCTLGISEHELTSNNIDKTLKVIHSIGKEYTDFIVHKDTCFYSEDLKLVGVAKDL